MRQNCLDLLRKESSKISLKLKRVEAALYDDYRAKLLFYITVLSSNTQNCPKANPENTD